MRIRGSLLVVLAVMMGTSCREYPETPLKSDLERQGRQVFRYDTFGNEVFWTDTAQLHKVLETIRPILSGA